MVSEPGMIRTEALDAEGRGSAYGAAAADRIAQVRTAYLQLFKSAIGIDEAAVLRLGEEVLAATSDWRAQIAEELAAVAKGAGQVPELIAALNARTEILAGSAWMKRAECTVLGRAAGIGAGAPWLVQNWDWNLDAPERLVVWDAAVPGGRYVSLTEAGMLAKIGVNDRGLALALSVLCHQTDGGPIGVPVHLILREVLATCSTADEVAALLDEARPSASSCLAVVCRDSPAAMFEMSPAGVARIEPAAGERLAHTNHFLHADLRAGESNLDAAESIGRLQAVRGSAPGTPADGKAALASHLDSGGPCRHPEPQQGELPAFGTFATVSLSPARGEIEWSVGPPCQGTWRRYTLGDD